MGLTDEDLELMASTMWEDLIPPPPPSSVDERKAEEKKKNEDSHVSPSPEANIKPNQIVRKAHSKEASGGSQNTRTRNRKRAAKKRTSLFAELEVSSPADISVRSKNFKLSKSMKGASQNESQAVKKGKKAGGTEAQLEEEPMSSHRQDTDPYSLPISPTSSGRVKKTASVKTDPSPSGRGTAKTSSPLAPGIRAHISSLHEKFSKPQKRIAKRSFLDPPETPQPETKSELQKQQQKQQLSLPKPAVSPPTKRQTKRTQPSAGFVKNEPSYPQATQKPAPDAEVTSKLRQRRERVPIIISSDSESSGEEDVEANYSDLGYMPSADNSSKQSPGDQLPDELKHANKHGKSADMNGAEGLVTPAATRTTAAMICDVQKHESNVQTVTAQITDSLNKRRVSPIDPLNTGRHEKKTKLSSVKDNAMREKVQAQGKMRSGKTGTTPHNKSSEAVQSGSANDPFVADARDKDSAQTNFTAKLLQSTGQDTGKSAQAVSQMHSVPLHGYTHGGLTPHSSNHPAQQAQRAKPDGVARQMMRLFADVESHAAAAENNGQQQPAGRDIWLDETETYGETSQIMGYVCKTILRFLKSKEGAIEDVANEYHQRGGVVLARVESLHETERHKLVQQFEEGRMESLRVFDAARHDVRLLTEKLQNVRLAPVVNSVFADNAASRLRALQA